MEFRIYFTIPILTPAEWPVYRKNTIRCFGSIGAAF
jgi:hypothetical protein